MGNLDSMSNVTNGQLQTFMLDCQSAMGRALVGLRLNKGYMRLIPHLSFMSLICSAMISPSFADCLPVSQGQKIIIEVAACEEIDASKNRNVHRLARPQDVMPMYTGALIKDKKVRVVDRMTTTILTQKVFIMKTS